MTEINKDTGLDDLYLWRIYAEECGGSGGGIVTIFALGTSNVDPPDVSHSFDRARWPNNDHSIYMTHEIECLGRIWTAQDDLAGEPEMLKALLMKGER